MSEPANRVVSLNDDMVDACAHLVGRSGATKFEIGYLHEGVPVEEAGWYATAFYKGVRISCDDQTSPTLAALGLAERLLRGATCRCGRLVSLSDGVDGCRWRLNGPRWEPGCDAPPLKLPPEAVGDPKAMNRLARRAAAKAAAKMRNTRRGE